MALDVVDQSTEHPTASGSTSCKSIGGVLWVRQQGDPQQVAEHAEKVGGMEPWDRSRLHRSLKGHRRGLAESRDSPTNHGEDAGMELDRENLSANVQPSSDWPVIVPLSSTSHPVPTTGSAK